MKATPDAMQSLFDQRDEKIAVKIVEAYYESCSHVFFFSSRRRHTRLQGDWSSDVCSSDLSLARELQRPWLTELRGSSRYLWCTGLLTDAVVGRAQFPPRRQSRHGPRSQLSDRKSVV